LDVARHPLNHVWKLYQRLDAWVPRLLCHGVRQRFPLKIFVSIHPLLKLNNFKWISGSGECLSQKWIWIESDRRNQRIQLINWNLWSFFGGRSRGCHHLRLRLGRRLRNGRVVGRDRSHACDGDHALRWFVKGSKAL
jgi:hypothetical protein